MKTTIFKIWKFSSGVVLAILLLPVIVFSEPVDQGLLELPDEATMRTLTLPQVSQLALENNFEIQLAKYDTWISRTGEDVAESIYDTVISAEVNYHKDKAQRTSTFAGTEERTNSYSVGVSKKLPTGTTVTVEGEDTRTWTDSSFVSLNPSHNASATVSVEQDLGRNSFGLQDRGSVKLARNDVQNAEFVSLDKIEQNLADVQKAYWDLVLQVEKVRIEDEMVQDAKRLFELNQEKIGNGLVEQPDLLASEANYQERVNEFLLEKNQLTTKENVLRLFLNWPDDALTLRPADGLDLPEQEEAIDRSLSVAFKNRYDYKKARKDMESRDITLEMKRNGVWPEVNLNASLARNGVDADFNDAAQRVSDENHPDFSAGMKVSWPWENTRARAELKASELEKAKALVSLKYLERKITIGVMDQVRLCQVLRELAVNALSVSDIQARKLAAEKKRFNQGRSDTDTIIRFQQDALRAKVAASEAKYAYLAAVIDLRQAEGSLLSTYWDGEI